MWLEALERPGRVFEFTHWGKLWSGKSGFKMPAKGNWRGLEDAGKEIAKQCLGYEAK